MTLSQDDIVFLSRVFCDYVKNTSDGKKTVFGLLDTTVRKADIKNNYQLSAKHPQTKQFNYTDLIYYAGWIYKGAHGVGIEDIEVEKNGNLEGCEATGIMGPKDYCVKVVREFGANGRDHLSSLSNYARMHSDNQQIRETASADICVRCTVHSCPYHPAMQNKPQLKLVTSTRGA
jgi:hypothetical protein